MKRLGVQHLPIDKIEVRARLRETDPADVDLLAMSIAEKGLQQPIVVALVKGAYVLAAGAHRLAACTQLKWPEIDASVVECTEDERLLLEVEENLIRRDLNAFDRAIARAEFQRIYEKLHPDTRRGVAGGKARHGSANEEISFARHAAARIGCTERTIQLSISIAKGLSLPAKERITGTWLALKQSELLALAKLPHDKQNQVLDRLLEPDGKCKSVRAAVATVDGHEVRSQPTDLHYTRLTDAWNRASENVRLRFARDQERTGKWIMRRKTDDTTSGEENAQ